MKLLILFLMACSVPAMEAIKCYECNSDLHNCDNLKTKEGDQFVIDCPKGIESCFVGKSYIKGRTLVTHGCFPKRKDGCEKVIDLDKKGEVCYCNTDKCNSSTVMTSSIVSMLTALLSVIVYNYYLCPY